MDAPDAFKPPPGHPRFPAFDGLRGVSVILVLIHHTAFTAGIYDNAVIGPLTAHFNVAVPILFAISGFLLYRPMVAERFGGGATPRLRDYARRRALRIVPGFWVALTLVALISSAPGVLSSQWWAFYSFLQTWPIYDIPTECLSALQFCGITTAWSLAVEASFYFALPLFWWLAGRLGRGQGPNQRMAVELTLLAALSIGSLAVQAYSLGEFSHSYLGFNITGTFIWFASGMALAVVSARYGELRDAIPDGFALASWTLALAILCLVSFVILPTDFLAARSTPQELFERVAYTVISILIIAPAAFGRPGHGPVRRLLLWRPVSWLGLISFGIYLYHVNVIKELADHRATLWFPGDPMIGLTLGAMLISIPLAALSYYAVERPFLRFK